MKSIITNKLLNFLVLLLIGVVVAVVDYYLPEFDLSKLTKSLIIIATLYFVLRVVFEFIIRKSFKYSRTRYSLRKGLRILFYGLSIISIINIWVQSTESLLVTYGLFSAGFALAMQDTVKNLFGGLMIYIGSLYQIGDRIEIGNTAGDVLDINFSYTTVLEIKEWIDGDQPTGRIIYIPNHKVLVQNINNYTKDHEFIWDEIKLPLTYGSNWRKAKQLILEYLDEKQVEILEEVGKQLELLGRNYYLEKRIVKPSVYFSPTDNWLDMRIRYVANTFERRDKANEIFEKLIEIIEQEPDIKVASQTIRVYGSEAEGS